MHTENIRTNKLSKEVSRGNNYKISWFVDEISDGNKIEHLESFLKKTKETKMFIIASIRAFEVTLYDETGFWSPSVVANLF